MKILKLGIVLLITLAFTSCRDTCKKLGDTFDAVSFQNVTLNTDGDMEVVLLVQSLDALPANYYEEFTIQENDDNELTAKSVFGNKDSIGLILSTDNINQGETKSIDLQLEYGDRQNYTSCKHPGQSDSWILKLEADIEQTTSNTFELKNLSWDEIHIAGAL